MSHYKYLVGPWLEIFDALGKDTEMKIVDDLFEESHTSPHEFQPPVSDEAVEIAKEIMEHCGYRVQLSDDWQGE